MNKSIFIGIKAVAVLFIILFVFVFLSAFTIDQTQEGILLRLGKIQRNSQGQAIILEPGLHFKIPFVTTVKRFDMRLRTLNIISSRIVTIEQKDVIVDAFVKWRINNIVAYYKATSNNINRTDNLLHQKVASGLRAEFGKQNIIELVSGKRTLVMDTIRKNANSVAQSLGLTVLDVRIKKIELPTEVAQSVFARMRSEREKEASLIRSEGNEKAEKIKSQADADKRVILAQAYQQAAVIKAEGDKKAASIYANTYNKNAEFYNFYRSLEAYKMIFAPNNKNTLVLSPQNKFFKYFKQQKNKQN